jgi:allantoinase
VGIWSLYELMDQYGLRGTVALNSDVCVFEPQVVQAGVARKWEWMGHGKTNSQYMAGLDEATERAVIEEVVRTITTATGAPPRGWLGPAGAESLRTPDLLAEAGIDYVMDWTADDEPFPMRVRKGRLISMPYGTVGDLPCFIQQGWTGEQFFRLIVDTFDALYARGERGGQIFALSLHPWVIGRPGRLVWLERAFAHLLSHDQLWLPTGSELADWYFDRSYAEALRLAPLPTASRGT